MSRWDLYFMELVRTVSTRSKDCSTKVGAVIVSPHKTVVSTGYNGAPRGLDDSKPILQTRPGKYLWVEHAERNAIYNAARAGVMTDGCTMYCSWPPCADCARAIIQSGIRRIVTEKNIRECPERWHEGFLTALSMLVECDITIKYGDLQND